MYFPLQIIKSENKWYLFGDFEVHLLHSVLQWLLVIWEKAFDYGCTVCLELPGKNDPPGGVMEEENKVCICQDLFSWMQIQQLIITLNNWREAFYLIKALGQTLT